MKAVANDRRRKTREPGRVYAMKKFLILILALALCLGGMCASAEEINWRACEGGELTVYVACGDEHGAAVLKAFQQKTGVNITYMRLSGNACYNRILSERDDPEADVWYGGTCDPFIAAAKEDLLYPYANFEHAPYKSESYGVGEPYWFGIYSGYIGFICDMGALEAAGVEPPRSWEDLAKPAYAGMICMANPAEASTGMMTVSILMQIYGEDRAMELVSAIDKNVISYVRTGAGVAARVAEGGAAIGVGFLHNGLQYIEEGSEKLQLVAPEEGTGCEVGGAAIVKGCKHLDAAKLFMAFAMSPEAQEIGQTVGSLQFLTVEGARDPEAAQAVTDMGVKLIDYDSTWTGENRDHIIEAWTSAADMSKVEGD